MRKPAHAPSIALGDVAMVALGGGLGGVARYLLAVGVASLSGHPTIFTILGINLVGGVAAGMLLRCTVARSRRSLFLVPGFLGGFTTFSAWGDSCANLVHSGNIDTALWGLGGGLLIGLFATWIVPRGRLTPPS